MLACTVGWCERCDDYDTVMSEQPNDWPPSVAGGSGEVDPENPYNFSEVPL